MYGIQFSDYFVIIIFFSLHKLYAEQIFAKK